jgi:hypothetical protein
MEKVEYVCMKRKWESQHLVEKKNAEGRRRLRASPEVLTNGTCKSISHLQVWIFNLLQPPPTELKLRLQIRGRPLIANHLD